MRRFLCWMLVIVTLFLFGCVKENYREDLSCTTLTTALAETLAVDGGYAFYSAEYVERSLSSPELYRDQRVIYSIRSENIDEIGVFLANSEADAESLLRVCQDFLQITREEQKAFIESYAPKEAAKLDGATAKRFGCYVVYAILEEDAQKLIFSELDTLLKK